MTAKAAQRYATVAGVRVSNPEKVWWPDDGITKLDLVRYYERISPHLLPWLEDRPLTAERCPDGMRGQCFYQKNFTRGVPEDVPTFPIRRADGKVLRYLLGGSLRTLLAMANLACIAIHVMNAGTDARDRPDWLAFDLDPASGEFADAARAGFALHELLEELRLRSYPKTSGSRGLHVFVPLRRLATQDAVRAFAFEVARELVARAPELVTTEFSKGRRGGKVFVDVMRNASAQTIVPPYSARRRPKAPVSTPLAWDEVSPRLDPSRFNIRTIARRLRRADPWADFWRRRMTLPRARGA